VASRGVFAVGAALAATAARRIVGAALAATAAPRIVGAALAAILVALLAVSAPALGHHSPAVFDRTREITIVGVVTEFRWGNPHCWIHLDVADATGATEAWSVEMNPASLLARNGWTSKTIQVGDKVEVKVHPLHNDEKGGQYISVKLPSGATMDENRRELEVVRP
jgi:hypothetical protein